MVNEVSKFLFTATGAFAIWMTKGFKGTFDSKMVSVDERNSSKGTVRYFLGLGIWILVGLIVFLIVK